MCISHWSCYRLLRSDTDSDADSLRHKTPQGILGGKRTRKHIFSPIGHLLKQLMRASFCVLAHLLCSWVPSSPMCMRTVHWPGGRCHCYGSYRSGYILPRRNQRGMLPGEGQQYHYLCMNPAHQTCLTSDLGCGRDIFVFFLKL